MVKVTIAHFARILTVTLLLIYEGILTPTPLGQLPVSHWHTYLGQATLADAILDRLVHNAYKIELKGESMRKMTRPLTHSPVQE